MMSHEEIDKLNTNNICYRCIGEMHLRTETNLHGQLRRCSYCKKRAKTYTIFELSKRIDEAFRHHYTRTSNQPTSWQQAMLADKEENYDWDRDGDPVIDAIANAAEIPDEATHDIQKILEDEYYDFESAAMGTETEYSSESHYEVKSANDLTWQQEWRGFEQLLKTEARFFSRTASAHLASVFSGISTMSTKDGRPLVINIGPNTTFNSIYRARAFQSTDHLKEALCRPDLRFGSPPAHAAKAGRMNALGISVFYGANGPRAAITEVRPPVGSHVAVAKFNIIRTLRILDLTALKNIKTIGSIFDRHLADRMEHAMFLQSLSQHMTRPVMPDDEAFDYLPTQAVADFLASEHEPPLDGIIFPSAQAAGDVLNVVLFHKAARIEALDIPNGANIEANIYHSGDDDWQPDFSVTEEVPAERASFATEPFILDHADPRETTLRIDLDSIKVHVVRRVDFDTVAHDVRRHRWVKHDPAF